MRELGSSDWLEGTVDILVQLVELAGALVIFVGSAIAFVRFCIVTGIKRDPSKYLHVRLAFGRYLALGLEFQLASDLLRSSIAPTFEQIGKLAAVAAIRTLLNFFLARELDEERRRSAGEAQAQQR